MSNENRTPEWGWLARLFDRLSAPTSAKPTPPENVVLVLADHTEVPVDCVYEGWCDGVHSWLVLVPTSCPWPAAVKIGTLPSKTGIRLEMDTL